jgi:hypothetical protein
VGGGGEAAAEFKFGHVDPDMSLAAGEDACARGGRRGSKTEEEDEQGLVR